MIHSAAPTHSANSHPLDVMTQKSIFRLNAPYSRIPSHSRSRLLMFCLAVAHQRDVCDIFFTYALSCTWVIFRGFFFPKITLNFKSSIIILYSTLSLWVARSDNAACKMRSRCIRVHTHMRARVCMRTLLYMCAHG